MSDSAIADVKVKWIGFNSELHLKSDVPLAKKIDLFAQPLAVFFQSKYSQLLLGGSQFFWLTIFTAILESGTHPKDEVNVAIAELERKYARNS